MIKKQSKKKKTIDPYVIRRWAIIGAIILVIGLTVLNVWLAKTVKVERAINQKQIEKSAETQGSGAGEAAMAVTLKGISHDGSAFKFSDTSGKLRLVFFGFTNAQQFALPHSQPYLQ